MKSQNNKENKSEFSYKETLNLLKTDFSMRANSVEREPDIQNFWSKNNIDLKLGSTNLGKIFTLHDGPPYANGDIHIGHAVNKILKDIIIRSKIIDGYNAPFIPGWDCHGLPIEIEVEKKIKKDQNISDKDLRLSYDNIFALNRIGTNEIVEGGKSLSLGFEYENRNKINEKRKYLLVKNIK